MNITDNRITLLVLFALALIFTIALTSATLELPRLLRPVLEGVLPNYNPRIPMEQEDIEQFITDHHLRLIGYGSLGVLLGLTIAGFCIKKVRYLQTISALVLFLPTFGYFAVTMFFLAGLGILRVLWFPFWDSSFDILRLGDIVLLPYMVIAYPLHIVFEFILVDNPNSPYAIVAGIFIATGIIIFLVGTFTWLYGKFHRKEIIDFWIYRLSRHPQYLGFIFWSYGLMLLAMNSPVQMGGINPGASLPWLLTTILVVGAAFNEEIYMLKTYSDKYEKYRQQAPFLLPMPKVISSALSLPMRKLTHDQLPRSKKQIAAIMFVYLGILIILSLPFVIADWPPGSWWNWAI